MKTGKMLLYSRCLELRVYCYDFFLVPYVIRKLIENNEERKNFPGDLCVSRSYAKDLFFRIVLSKI